MAIANEHTTGQKPEFILSYDNFAGNESHLKAYWPDVKWHIIDTDTNTLSDSADFDNIDFVSSVCPCAGMSMLNTATRGADNTVNNWLYKVAEFTLSNIKPTVYWGENAPGLYSDQNQLVLDTIRGYCNKYGYSFSIYKTDTFLHGIPQHRVRTFFFCWKGTKSPYLEWEDHPSNEPFKEWILNKNVGTMCENIIDVDPVQQYPEMRWIMQTRCGGSYSKYIEMFYDLINKYSIHTPYEYIVHFNLWDEYKSWLSIDPQKDKPLSANGSRTPWYYVNYRKEKVDAGLGFFAPQPIVYSDSTNAIISKCMNWILHPVEQRFLNTREIMSMMGMPTDYNLVNHNLQQVTQNVPVKTASDMTKQVIKYIKGELKISDSSFIKQDNINKHIDYEEISSIKLF